MKTATYKLRTMMADELTEKKQAITCILDYYRAKGQILDEFEMICKLMELSIGDVSQILGDIISDMESEIRLKGL